MFLRTEYITHVYTVLYTCVVLVRAFVCNAERTCIGTTESTEHNTEKTLVKGKRPLCLPFQSNRTPLSPLSFSLCPRFRLAVLSECSLFLSCLFHSFSVSLSPTKPIDRFTRNNQRTWPFSLSLSLSSYFSSLLLLPFSFFSPLFSIVLRSRSSIEASLSRSREEKSAERGKRRGEKR